MMRNAQKKMKVIKQVLSISASFAFLSYTSVAMASDKNDVKVDVDTPDKVLLEDKNLEKMFKVKKPSETLAMTIEGVKHEIQIKLDGDTTRLVIPAASGEKAEEIRKTYQAMTKTDKVVTEIVKQ
jgi:N-acetyl-beta-hexosaminidase